MHTTWEDLDLRPNKKKGSVVFLFDTQAGLYEQQSKIEAFNGAQFMIYYETDLHVPVPTACRTATSRP